MSERIHQGADRPELERIGRLEQASGIARLFGYLRLMGPGYMQSAMTLGGGTAFSAIFAGAAFGYRLLWVAPVGMLLGIIVLAAVAHQTLSTGRDPFEAMKQHAGSFFAYGWGLAAILSSIIWQFAQYALAASMLVLLARELGWENAPRWVMGLVALVWCVSVGLMYDRSGKLMRVYENVLKGMVWLIIVCFAFVVIRAGVPEPGQLLAGLIPNIPPDATPAGGGEPISSIVVIVSGLAAAVGVNMLFVYPYSLRRREWGREHRRLARYDLIFGMFVPYAIAASLIVIASASVLHFGEPELFTGAKIPPDRVAEILASPDRLGPVAGVWVFGLGIIAMALSSITMQMLCSGFACEVMFGWRRGSRLHLLGTLLPAIGVLGAVFWSDVAMWVAVPTNIICGLLMPLAYVGFIILQRSRAYLGDDLPTGSLAGAWLAGMVLSTVVLTAGLVLVVVREAPGYVSRIAQSLAHSESSR
ncbi:MAG: hypothetical protein D6695_03060 [Planctomycetota bacterium]|nr:MAG: hypothetical protein D6695_03060 [Planctomycetota bacterium]